MEKKIDKFWSDYNSAMNNPAPLDDGGTSQQEVEELLERATDLLDAVWISYRSLLAEQAK